VRTLAALTILLTLPASSQRYDAARPDATIREGSRVWISGASNLRRFTCKARQVSGALELRGTPTTGPLLTGTNVTPVPSIELAVDGIDCGIGGMNRHLREALHSQQHPRIEFRLRAYEVDVKPAPGLARVDGHIVIAGVERPLMLTATLRADTLGTMHVAGRYDLHPSDFGIVPPRRFAGLLRVRDRVTVHFDIVLGSDGGTLDDICRSLALAGHPQP